MYLATVTYIFQWPYYLQNETDTIYLDISKAFDSVLYNKLLNKIGWWTSLIFYGHGFIHILQDGPVCPYLPFFVPPVQIYRNIWTPDNLFQFCWNISVDPRN